MFLKSEVLPFPNHWSIKILFFHTIHFNIKQEHDFWTIYRCSTIKSDMVVIKLFKVFSNSRICVTLVCHWIIKMRCVNHDIFDFNAMKSLIFFLVRIRIVSGNITWHLITIPFKSVQCYIQWSTVTSAMVVLSRLI